MRKLLLAFSALFLFVGIGLAQADDKNKTVTNNRNALIFAYSPVNSVFEDDNIRLEIYDEQLYAFNKTKKTIFFDLSQCFLVHNGTSYPMYDAQRNEKNSNRANATILDEYLSIPPMSGDTPKETFIASFSGYLIGNYSTSETPSGKFSDYEKRLLETVGELLDATMVTDEKGRQQNITTSASKHFLEDESVSTFGASIAYAFNKRAEDWSQVAISTWVSDIIFAPLYAEIPAELKKEDKKGFGIKETKPVVLHIKADTPFEFDHDKSPLVVRDFQSDINSGKFSLLTTRIAKTKRVNPFVAGLLTIATGGLGAVAFAPYEEYAYKSIINFDGVDADWGEMKYAKNLNSAIRKNK